MAHIIYIFILIGILSGSLSGLLGIGGGSVIVPALAYTFIGQKVDENTAMHMAASTSLAIMCLTSQASARSHSKKIQIDWHIYRSLLPGIMFGVAIGHIGSILLSGHVLKICFAIFLIIVAVRMLGFEFESREEAKLPGRFGMTVAGTLIGGKSGLLGIGGGAITIPFLTYFNVSMRQSIAISALVSFTVASIGATINLLEPATNLHASWMTGYIYWPAVILVAIPSIVAAKLNVKISHRMPVDTLRKLFAILLLLTSCELLMR